MRWPWQKKTQPEPRQRQPILPEEIGELRCMSLEVHYGDEPLYFSDPPEWPDPTDYYGRAPEVK